MTVGTVAARAAPRSAPSVFALASELPATAAGSPCGFGLFGVYLPIWRAAFMRNQPDAQVRGAVPGGDRSARPGAARGARAHDRPRHGRRRDCRTRSVRSSSCSTTSRTSGCRCRRRSRTSRDRIPVLDAQFFVTAVLTQRESGGNLSEVLDNLATIIRERFKVKRQVRVHLGARPHHGLDPVGAADRARSVLRVHEPRAVHEVLHGPAGRQDDRRRAAAAAGRRAGHPQDRHD